MDITDLPMVPGALLFMAAALLIAVGPLFAARRLAKGDSEQRTVDLAAQVALRIGALHGLIVALIFAEVQTRYGEQRRNVELEAAATADLFYDLGRFGGAAAGRIEAEVASYTRTVIATEWPLLRQGRLSSEAWDSYDRFYDEVLDLPATSARQIDLRQAMLSDIQKISEFRQARLFASHDQLSALFWFVAIIGFLLTCALFITFRLTPVRLLLVAAYAVYIGLTLYFIAVMNNPFSGPARLEPTAMRTLYDDAMRDRFGGP